MLTGMYFILIASIFRLFFPAENRAKLARVGKNFLPILFNLFTTDPEKEQDPSRLALLDTVKVYLQIADAKVTS